MVIDEEFLASHRGFEDARLGIRERFVDLELTAGDTIGVVSEPLGERRGGPWLLCHSFGTEQVDLQMTEVGIARSVAAAGHPVVRFHALGYGDSWALEHRPRLATQVRDCIEVAGRLEAITGAAAEGTMGARLGAAIAALVADRLGLNGLVAIAPVVDGARYMNEQLRSRVLSEMVKRSEDDGGSTMEEARARLMAGGVVSIKGWPLDRGAYEELNALKVLDEISSFGGRALVVQVSRGTEPRPAEQAVGRRLEALGATVTMQTVTDPSAAHFGYEHFQSVEKDFLADSLGALNETLTRIVGAWVSSGSAGRGADG